MKRFLSAVLLVSLSLFGLQATASPNYKYQKVGVGAKSSNGLVVTVDSVELVQKQGSTQLVVTYTQKNTSKTKRVEERSFKLFFTNGTSEPQYGGFGYLFPGDELKRTYTWEFVKSKRPLLIEWGAGFFAKKPTAKGFKWRAVTALPRPTQSSTPSASPSVTPSQSSTVSP